MLLAARDKGFGPLACDLAALLGERDIFRAAQPAGMKMSSDSDLLDRVEALARWRENKGRSLDADPVACRTVDRTATHLRRLMGLAPFAGPLSAGTVGLLLAHAYPDRIARQREPGSERYLLESGQGCVLSAQSALHDQPFLVAVNMDGGERGEAVIRTASAVSRDMLRTEFATAVTRQRVVEWDRLQGRVIAREEERLGSLTLSSRQISPAADEVRQALLAWVTGGRGLTALNWTPEAGQLCARVNFLGRLFPDDGWPDLSDATLAATLEDWLGPFLAGLKTLADIAGLDLVPPLKGLLTWQQARRLDEGAPTHLVVPSGSRIPLHYADDAPPVMAVKLQELFGLADTPTVAWGKEPVVLHLLSPARRPVQVTQDLRGFWNNGYPEVKKELKGRYPKHPWPDDPWLAVPTRHVKKRH
ncbi:MAG TPA: ATP-dependent helicase C-terminal domain-containing protein, partial [Geobacteraceae bacterium]|nr:ATP-dependent helicase C-terminal domain-containing protein [Geobacteraceae bacterium]